MEQLKGKASMDDIAVTASSAKSKVNELMIANNAVRFAIGISDFAFVGDTPLVLREEAERIRADKELQQ